MLNTVGYVDYGRIGTDTGHTFAHSKRVATSIATRYYMNRNFFVSDPDAVNLSDETPAGQSIVKRLSLDEAKVSVALAAVSGGMFEIGDDLPSLSKSPKRLALLENQDLLDMVRLGKASVPLDLMNFTSEDGQPSLFLLRENARQSILTIFNWTDKTRNHSIDLEAAGLFGTGKFKITDVLNKDSHVPLNTGLLKLSLRSHSVRVLKIENEDVSAVAPAVAVDRPATGTAGDTLGFAAHNRNGDPVLSYRWDFGDGVILEGASATHAFTQSGDYDVRLTATGVDGWRSDHNFQVRILERKPTPDDPIKIQRYEPADRSHF
jgi:alpha-galactosidase